MKMCENYPICNTLKRHFSIWLIHTARQKLFYLIIRMFQTILNAFLNNPKILLIIKMPKVTNRNVPPTALSIVIQTITQLKQ